jgi:hypothetical protein
MSRKSRRSPTFKQWLKTFRETGRPSNIGVIYFPTQEMTDEELHEIYKNTASIRRRHTRRLQELALQRREQAERMCRPSSNPVCKTEGTS